MTVTIIGMDGRPLDTTAAKALAEAVLVIGAPRHLRQVQTHGTVIEFTDLAAAITAVRHRPGPTVVLASGDPGFFGIVRALRSHGIEPVVHPAVSSIATAFGRQGLTWDDAVVVSAHGRELAPALNACRAHPKVAVFTAPGAGPNEIGAALDGLRRVLVVAEQLGGPAERITACTPAEAATGSWAEPNVVLVLDPDAPLPERGWIAGPQPPAAWALPESAFEHRDSMITKAEVRALLLARIAPRTGMLIWDIGAGSGSVGIECARFGAAVIAVEKDPATRIAANAARHGVHLQVVTGEAPECLDSLPAPDAVFVGGGGQAVLGACLARGPRTVVAAFATVERVGPAMRALTEAGYRAEGVQLAASRFAPLGEGTRLAAANPVFVIWGDTP